MLVVIVLGRARSRMASKSSRPEYSMMTLPLPFLSSIATLRPRRALQPVLGFADVGI